MIGSRVHRQPPQAVSQYETQDATNRSRASRAFMLSPRTGGQDFISTASISWPCGHDIASTPTTRPPGECKRERNHCATPQPETDILTHLSRPYPRRVLAGPSTLPSVPTVPPPPNAKRRPLSLRPLRCLPVSPSRRQEAPLRLFVRFVRHSRQALCDRRAISLPSRHLLPLQRCSQ